MNDEIAELLARVGDFRAEAGRGDFADVADLSAGLAVERRLVEDERAALAALQRLDLDPVLEDRADDALRGLRLVAQKLGRADALAQSIPDRFGRRFSRARPGAPRLGPLALHRGVECRRVDRQAAGAQSVLRQIERKAISVVEAERRLAVQDAAVPKRTRLVLENGEAPRQRRAEARLLELQRLGDQRLRADQLWIGLAHLARQRRDEAPHQGIARAQDLRVAHGAAHDAAEHIAAALVRRQHAVGDQEGGGAQVIGDHPVRGALRPVGIDAGQVRAGADERAEKVDVVIVVHALQHGGDALEPHAGVDGRTGQVDPLAAAQRLELHEDEIPDLDETVAVGVGRAGRTAWNVVPVIVENLRARAARAGVAHRPEIVACGDADDPRLGEARDLAPQVERLVIVVIDGDGELLGRQPEVARQKIPGEFDRIVLEIIAEREIAEHLEEGVVARGIADIVEVVVLAAGAHALLRRRRADVGALLDPGEDILELHHAGVGEHEGRIVARHERARRNDGVVVPAEELEKVRSDVVDAAHEPRSPEDGGLASAFLKQGCRKRQWEPVEYGD